MAAAAAMVVVVVALTPHRLSRDAIADAAICLTRLSAVPLDEDALLLDPATGAIVHVDPRGAATHALLAEGASLEDVATLVASASGVEPENVLADLVAFAGTCAAGACAQRAPESYHPRARWAPEIAGRFVLLGEAVRLSIPAGAAAAEMLPLIAAQPAVAANGPALEVSVRPDGPAWRVCVGDISSVAQTGEVAWEIAEGLARVRGLGRSGGTLAWHASAVVGPAGAIVLVGEAGAGKSTLAGWLAACGMPHLSDDILPVCPGTEHVWPSPWAMSVKPGSWPVLGPLYAGLDRAPVMTTLAGKRVKSIRPAVSAVPRHYPIAAILQVRHRPDDDRVVAAPWSVSQTVQSLSEPFGGLPRTAETLAGLVETIRRATRLTIAYPSADALVEEFPDLFPLHHLGTAQATA